MSKVDYFLAVRGSGLDFIVSVSKESFVDVMDKIAHYCKHPNRLVTRYYDSKNEYIGASYRYDEN